MQIPKSKWANANRCSLFLEELSQNSQAQVEKKGKLIFYLKKPFLLHMVFLVG